MLKKIYYYYYYYQPKRKFGVPLYPPHYDIFGGTGGYFQKLSPGCDNFVHCHYCNARGRCNIVRMGQNRKQNFATFGLILLGGDKTEIRTLPHLV